MESRQVFGFAFDPEYSKEEMARMDAHRVTTVGMFPESCFHHGSVSRLKAEQILTAAKEDGGFLVRKSESVSGAHVLCLLFQGKVHKYQILRNADGALYIQAHEGVEYRSFPDISHLISSYVDVGVNNGLCCALVSPVSPGNCHPVTHDDDDDDSSDDELGQDIPVRTDEEIIKMRGTINLSAFFCQQFMQLDMSSTDGQFVNCLREYAEMGVKTDAETVTSGGTELNCLRTLLGDAATDLERQVKVFLGKVDLCRQLFGPLNTPPYVPKNDTLPAEEPSDLTAILERLIQCQTAITHLEKKAQVTLRDLMTNDSRHLFGDTDESPFVMNLPPPVIPPVDFESRLLKHGKPAQRIKLTVDIQSGRLYVVKPSAGVLNDSCVFTHDRILQLIKNSANKSQLDMLFEGCKKESHVFEDVRQRESFCQLVQQLRNHHSESKQVDQLSVFVGTWNMGDEPPPTWNLSSWLKGCGKGKTRSDVLQNLPHDLYVIGTQESGISEKEWVGSLKATLHASFGVGMHTVATVALWGICLVVLVKTEYRNNISHVQQSTVKTGLANALGVDISATQVDNMLCRMTASRAFLFDTFDIHKVNEALIRLRNKGAVGLSFDFNATSFCFVCAHLAARQERVNKRNQNYVDILKGMNVGPKNLSTFDITSQFHHLFFIGDLNYRLDDIQATDVIQRVSQADNFASLLEHDQLRSAQNNNQAFVGFSEEEITFPPTYRFEVGSRTKYAWQKFKKTGTRINTPSWCDRVLWRSYRDTYLSNTSYGCTDSIVTSDHKPVFASFDVAILGQFVSEKGTAAQPGDKEIIFDAIKVELKTSIRENILIEFHSACLEGAVVTKPTGEITFHAKDNYSASWSQFELPKMLPIFDDIEYLDEQHLLLAVKGADSLDSYGECVLSLKSRLSVWPQSFNQSLMHHGEVVGCIWGKMHIKSKQGIVSPFKQRYRRSYELIYTESPSQPKKPTTFRSTLPSDISCDEPLEPSSPPSPMATPYPLATPSPTATKPSPFATRSPLVTPPPAIVPRVRQPSPPTEYAEIMTLSSSQTYERGLCRSSSPVQYAVLAPSAGDLQASRMVENDLYDVTRRSTLSQLSHEESQCRRVAYMFDDESVKKSKDGVQTEPPSSVEEWLGALQLGRYIDSFLQQGWDHLDFLHLLTDADLVNLGVCDPGHRRTILDRISGMKQ